MKNICIKVTCKNKDKIQQIYSGDTIVDETI